MALSSNEKALLLLAGIGAALYWYSTTQASSSTSNQRGQGNQNNQGGQGANGTPATTTYGNATTAAQTTAAQQVPYGRPRTLNRPGHTRLVWSQ
jgi:hypothetical protein